MSFLKGTKIYSIVTGYCPVCHNESMYTEPNPYKVTRTLTMEESCSFCDTKYQIEPSFFFGAMYVSYPVGLIIGGVALFIAYFVFQLTLMGSYLVLCFVMLATLPLILRVSRNIWINLFMTYDKAKAKKH